MSDLPGSSSKDSASKEQPAAATLPDKSTVKASAKTQASPSPQKLIEPGSKKAKTGLLWFFTLVNLLCVVALIGAAYWYYMQVQAKQDNSNVIEQKLNATEQALQQTQQNVRQQLGQLNNNQASLSDAMNDLNQIAKNNEKNLAASAQKLAEMAGRRPSDWLLAEANYLVNMAGRKLYLEQDPRTAVTLLSEADLRLADLNDPSLFPVRALIAADIQALQQVNPVSSSSVALALAGMLPSVNDLPMDTLQLPETVQQDDLTLSEDVNDWRQNLSRTWRAIVGDFISIKQVNAPLEPYLAERQQWLITQQIKHALSQAQSAALSRDQALFVSAIQQAMTALVEHYTIEDAKVGAFIEALQNLQNTQLSQDLPSKLESQASLKDIIERRIQGLYNNRSPIDDPSVNAIEDGAL